MPVVGIDINRYMAAVREFLKQALTYGEVLYLFKWDRVLSKVHSFISASHDRFAVKGQGGLLYAK